MLRTLLPNLTTTQSTAASAIPPLGFPHHQSVKPLTPATKNDPSLTLDFLKNSCGLSSESALSVSKRFQLKTTKKPHAVIALLKDHGFTKTHLARLVTARPRVLLAHPDKTLNPKLQFFQSLGIPDPDIARLLSYNSVFLLSSWKNRMVPNLQRLRSILPTDHNIASAIKRSPLLLLSNLPKLLLPKVETLKSHGMPEALIKKLVATHPRCLIEQSNYFEETFTAIKEMGISPSSSMFVHAFRVLSKLRKPAWGKKMENYRSLGWSEKEVRWAFSKHPYCMSASAEKVRRIVEFFADQLQWGPAYVSMNPTLLSLSFEKRIVPRFLVMRILLSKGLMKGKLCSAHFMQGEEKFLNNYVIKYQGKAPKVVDAITGKMSLEVLEMASNEGDWSHDSCIKKYRDGAREKCIVNSASHDQLLPSSSLNKKRLSINTI